MDVAKYIVTAVVISSLFGDLEPTVMYVGGVIAVLGTLGWGLFLVSEKPFSLRRFLEFFRRFFRIRRNRNNNP